LSDCCRSRRILATAEASEGDSGGRADDEGEKPFGWSACNNDDSRSGDTAAAVISHSPDATPTSDSATCGRRESINVNSIRVYGLALISADIGQ
jgi:hypothetical protein